nr:helix-turn-helix domain-containing protein [uncultured Oscillibacter sp.]
MFEYEDIINERKQESLPIVLSPTEAMEALGVGKNTIYRLLNTGKLPAVRIGRAWKIPISALHEMLQYTSCL